MTVLQFPDVASGQEAPPVANAQVPAPVRAHTREAPEIPPMGGHTWTPAWALAMPRLISGVFTGASVVASPPPSITGDWARQRMLAEYYRTWFARWARYAFGALHAFVIVAALYLLGWATDSPPKFAVCAGVAALALWQLHVI